MENEELEARQMNEVAETAAVAAAQVSGSQTRAIMRVVIIVVFVLLFILGALWVFYTLQGILLLVVLSVFFAYLIAPLVEFVRRPVHLGGRGRVVPRVLAIGIVYLAIFGSLGLTSWLLYPHLNDQMAQLTQQAPTYITNIRNSSASQRLQRIYQRFPPNTRQLIDQKVSETVATVGSSALDVAAWLVYLPWLVLIPILAFFFLKDAESFRRSALQMLPQGRLRWRGDEFFQDVNSTLAAYIRAQLIACLIIGSICTLGFVLIGVRYALVLGVVAGLLEFIPLLGPLVVAVVATSVAGFDASSKAIVVLLFLGVLRIVQDYVLYPRIIGSGIHLHPLAVILAILSGHDLAGLAGIFLAIPVIAIITVTYRHWLEHRGGTGLVAELLKTPESLTPATVEAPPVATDGSAPLVPTTPHAPPAPTDA